MAQQCSRSWLIVLALLAVAAGILVTWRYWSQQSIDAVVARLRVKTSQLGTREAIEQWVEAQEGAHVVSKRPEMNWRVLDVELPTVYCFYTFGYYEIRIYFKVDDTGKTNDLEVDVFPICL